MKSFTELQKEILEEIKNSEEKEYTFDYKFDEILKDLNYVPTEKQREQMIKFCKRIHNCSWTADYELEGRIESEEMMMICKTIISDDRFVAFYEKCQMCQDDRVIRELYRFYRHELNIDDAELIYQAIVDNDEKCKEELQFRYPGVRLIKTHSQDLACPNNIAYWEDSSSPTPEERSELKAIYKQADEEGLYDDLRTLLTSFWNGKKTVKRSVDDVKKIYNDLKNQQRQKVFY
jgi:hypothetical protein